MSARKPFVPPATGTLTTPPRTVSRRPVRGSAPRGHAWACALLGVLALTAGCRSGTTDPIPNPSAVAEEDANWFCESGDENGEWACVRDQELDNAAPAQPASSAPAADAPAPRTAAQAPAPQPPARPTAAAPATPAPAPPAAAPRESAYRPDRPVPLTEVPPDYYIVQLVALGTKEALEEYVTRKALQGMSAARVERGGRLFYVLLLGVYPDRQAADNAAANLPPELGEFDPWVRRLESLQQAIRRGDELAGTTEI